MKHDVTQTNGQPCTEVERLRRRVAELEAIQAEHEASQEQYRTLVENISDVLYAVDEAGRITYISPAVEPLSGYTPSELLGRLFFEFLRPDEVAVVRESFPQALHEQLEPIECRVLTKAGEVRWVQSSRQPIIQDGQTRGVRGVLTDISKRKQTEETFQDSLERFDLAMQATGEGVWEGKFVITADGFALDEVYYSFRFKALLGYADDEFANTRQSWENLLYPDDHARVMRALGKHLVYRVPFQGDYRLRTKAGEYRWFSARGQAQWNATGQPVRMAGSIRDITDHKQLQQSLNEAEAHYRTVVEHASDAILILQDSKPVYWNPVYEQLLGYTDSDIGARNFTEYIAPEDRKRVSRYYLSRLRGEPVPNHSEVKLLTRAGQRITMDVKPRIIPYRGQPATLVVMRDMTERKQAEEELQDSEQRYRNLVENSLGLICTHDLEGTVLSVNPAAAQSLGYQPGEGVGSSLCTFLAPAVRPLFDEYLTRMRQRGRDRGYMRVLTKTGEERVWEYRNVCCEEAGRPPYVLGHAQDVTERMQAEEELRQAHAELEQRVQERTAALAATNDALRSEIAEREQAEEALQESNVRYQNLVESSYDLIQSVAADGRFLFVNQAWLTQLGYTQADLPDLHVFDIIHPYSRPHCQEVFARVLAGESCTNIQALFMAKDGTSIPVEGNVTARSQAGQVIATHGFFRDITERKKAEAAMLQAKDAAEAANRLKSEFLATMSHELRTPLHIILGYLGFVTEGETGPLSEQALSTLGRVREKTLELFDLITAVLDVSRLEAGRMSVDLQTVQVAELLATLQEEMQDLQAASPLTCVWQSAAELPPLTTDLHKLKMILKNLIANAIKFTKQGSLTVAAQNCSGGVEISVTDTGIGIPAEALTTIFEPFRQVDGSDARGYEGVGLGLYIVQRMVELLQGTITVESEVGRGSTFRVWLPAEPRAVRP